MSGAAPFSGGQGSERDGAGSRWQPTLSEVGIHESYVREGAILAAHQCHLHMGHKLGKFTEPKRFKTGVPQEILIELNPQDRDA